MQRLKRKDECFFASDQYPNGKFYAAGESVPEADGGCRYVNRKRKFDVPLCIGILRQRRHWPRTPQDMDGTLTLIFAKSKTI